MWRLLLCLLLLLGLAGTASAQAPSGGKAPSGGTKKLTIALNGFENNLTPFTITFLAFPNTHDLVNLVYDTLFWSQAKEDPEPWLAEKAVPADDFRTWTVTLRPGVTWHDGQPLTAEDVKFSFDYYQRQAGASGRYAHHVSDVPPFQAAEVVDPLTVRFTYKAPAPTFKILPGADLPIIPKHIWENITEPAKASTNPPVGSGPYKVVEIVPDQRYRLQANPSYFKGKPTVDQIDMPIVKDPAAAFAALRTGQADFVSRDVPPELVGQFAKAPGFKVAKGTKFESTQLYFNAKKPPLSDPRVRKAISLGIDNKALVDTVLLGRGRPGLDNFIHPESPWALPGATHEHDPARAQRLLDEAGFAARDADGVRKGPDGKRLDFSVLVSSFEPQDIRAVQLAGQQVAPIGVKLTAEALDPATQRQRRQPPGPGLAPTYDAYMGTLETHGHVDPDALYYFFHSPGPKGFGAQITGYSNPRFDALVEQASASDIPTRKPLLQQAERILAQETPVVVFWYRDGEWAYRSSAYDGWVSDFGQGLLTKRSFLPEYVKTSSVAKTGGSGGGGSSAGVWLGVAAAVVVVGALVAVGARRRRAEADAEG